MPWLLRLLGEGQVGVQVFFVLSGFLITWLLLAEGETVRPRQSQKVFIFDEPFEYCRRPIYI